MDTDELSDGTVEYGENSSYGHKVSQTAYRFHTLLYYTT